MQTTSPGLYAKSRTLVQQSERAKDDLQVVFDLEVIFIYGRLLVDESKFCRSEKIKSDHAEFVFKHGLSLD